MVATRKRKAALKTPFPYMGGKSRVADLVWNRFGAVQNFIEPFAGGLAVLLRRPDHSSKVARPVETVNDRSHFLTNFWRAVRSNPDAVAEAADWPVSEVDLHSRHRWLVESDASQEIREKVESDPDFFDARTAGWWCWGQCLWIGAGWCQEQGRTVDGGFKAEMPHLGQKGKGAVAFGGKQRPYTSNGHSTGMPGVCGRPQIADAFDHGRGVHGNGHVGTAAERRAWLVDWMRRLSDRLRLVRVCCGHWSRVCDSPSTLTRLGLTGVFLDPPYPMRKSDGSKSRAAGLYAGDEAKALDELRDEVLAWCKKWGGKRKMRIAVCGYDTDGYAELESIGWERVRWTTQGGYGNRSGKGNANKRRECIWFSPGCVKPAPDLFSGLAAEQGPQL